MCALVLLFILYIISTEIHARIKINIKMELSNPEMGVFRFFHVIYF